MIARLLSPFADARLRRVLTRALNSRDQARAEVRRLDARLKQSQWTAATNYALAERWKAIAQGAQSGLAAERARTQETAGRCGDVAPSLSLLAGSTRPTCRLTAGHAGWHRGDDSSEWTLTEETHP